MAGSWLGSCSCFPMYFSPRCVLYSRCIGSCCCLQGTQNRLVDPHSSVSPSPLAARRVVYSTFFFCCLWPALMCEAIGNPVPKYVYYSRLLQCPFDDLFCVMCVHIDMSHRLLGCNEIGQGAVRCCKTTGHLPTIRNFGHAGDKVHFQPGKPCGSV